MRNIGKRTKKHVMLISVAVVFLFLCVSANPAVAELTKFDKDNKPLLKTEKSQLVSIKIGIQSL